MVQRDLDAALQLLADRAQYITGANGAAIALRRRGKNDMQCRASAGENVPELGALLSTEFGLSGESVRTRQALRCDDAERDPRVNREGCRQLGIASVVVMPVVNDDEVLGVFELFSGKVNAFGERDLSALQRLSEMVETAVKLARAAELIPGRAELAVASDGAAVGDGEIWAGAGLGGESAFATKADSLMEECSTEPLKALGAAKAPAGAERTVLPTVSIEVPAALAGVGSNLDRDSTSTLASSSFSTSSTSSSTSPLPAKDARPFDSAQGKNGAPGVTGVPAKPLFWSAAMNPVTQAEAMAEPDRSHVPPGLRNLRSCEVCGFPVSLGRVLCVECEEKRWRGQLKRPSAVLGPKVGLVSQTMVAPSSDRESAHTSNGPQSLPVESLRAGLLAKAARTGVAGVETAASGPVARLMAAAAQSAAAAACPAPIRPSMSPAEAVVAAAVLASKPEEIELRNGPEGATNQAAAAMVAGSSGEGESVSVTEMQEGATPDFVLSAGLEPSRYWLTSLYVVAVVLLVGAAVAATIFLR
jgi:hypothetical protein